MMYKEGDVMRGIALDNLSRAFIVFYQNLT